MKKILYIIGALVLVAVLYGWSTYNSLVTAKVSIDNQWAQVETQYQRRLDLIPNLVESTKGVMKQEQAVFTALAEARTKYSGSTTVDQKAKAAGEVESALGRLLAVVENYPVLKSSETMQTFMAELAGTENRVSVERKRFNDMVGVYNLKTKTFPSSLFAKIFGFDSANYFESDSGAEKTPAVKF